MTNIISLLPPPASIHHLLDGMTQLPLLTVEAKEEMNVFATSKAHTVPVLIL